VRAAALLFDLDGVLVDSRASVDRHWAEWTARHGIDLEAVRAIMHGRRSVDIVSAVAPGLDARREAEVVNAAQARDEDVTAIDGAATLLRGLPPERWAVVTSGPRSLALARLRFAGLPIPPRIVTAEDVRRGKPDPTCYLQGARAVGVSPTDCVAVEDAPAGIRAARDAGMGVIGVATTHPARDLADADAIVPSLAALDVSMLQAGWLDVEVATGG
jgi:sugar-phosphatase